MLPSAVPTTSNEFVAETAITVTASLCSTGVNEATQWADFELQNCSKFPLPYVMIEAAAEYSLVVLVPSMTTCSTLPPAPDAETVMRASVKEANLPL